MIITKKFYNMKNTFSAFFVALFTLSFATVSFAQYDDLYFDPATDEATTTYEVEEYTYEAADDADSNEYDEYEYYDDQDFHYSSRIRRFNRASTGFGYYDPFFTDASYYNRAARSGVSIYLGNPYSYSSYRRAVRNNFYSPLGFNNVYSRYGGFNPYSNVGFNNYGRTFYGGGSAFGGASSYNAYCPPTSYGSARTVRRNTVSTSPAATRGTGTSSSRRYDSSVRRGTNRTQSVRGTSTTRSRSSNATNNTRSSNRRTYAPSRSSRRTYSTPSRSSSRSSSTRSNSSSRRSYSSPSRSSSRSFSTPSRSSSRSSSSSRRQ